MISSRGMPPYWATQLCAALKFVFSRIAWAIRGMYDNKAYFLPFWFLQICSGFVSMKKLMFQYVARAKCLLIIIRTEYILFVLQINHTMSMTM